MKKHFEFYHAFQVVQHHTDIVTMSDSLGAAKNNEDVGGYPLGLDITEAKIEIGRTSQALVNKSDKIQNFIDGHDSYNMKKYTNKNHSDVLSDKASAKVFAGLMSVVAQDDSIITLIDLSNIQVQLASTLSYANSINLINDKPHHYLLMMNDWLDVSDYTLRGIDHKTGQVILMPDEEKKELVRRMLNQFRNLLRIIYPATLQTEVNALVAVKNKVLADLDIEPLLNIADYITTNTNKVPLFRRLWSI